MFPTQNRIRRNRSLDEFEAPLGDVLGAVAEDSWTRSPFSSGQRSRELFEAEYGRSGWWNLLTTGELWSDPDSALLSAEDARRRIGEEGLDLQVPDSGIRARALDILIERKKDERRRQDTLSRSPTGLGAGSLKLATALGVSLLDPLNVAASFVPIVGPGRYGAMLTRASGGLGRAAVRARVGIAEGVAGQALVEPLVYGAALQEQADYGLADSFVNLTFGSVLGGGLHVGGGAIADAIARGRPWQTARAVDGPELVSDQLPQEARAALLRASVAQAVEGKVTRIDGLMEVAQRSAGRNGPLFDSAIRQSEVSPASLRTREGAPPEGRQGDVAVIPTRSDGSRLEIGGGAVPNRGLAVANVFQDGKAYIGDPGDLHFNLMERYGTPDRGAPGFVGFITPEGRLLDRQEAFRWVTENEARIGSAESASGQLDAAHYRDQVPAELRRERLPGADRSTSSIDGRPISNLSERADRNNPGQDGIAPERSPPRLAAVEAGAPSNPLDRLREDARLSHQPESTRLADMNAADRGDTQLAAMKSDELTRVMAEADQAVSDLIDTARVLEADEAALAAIQEIDGLTMRAQEYGRAVKAAAECSLRRGV